MEINTRNILMCWNVPREMTEDLIYELFCNAGPIADITFGRSGKSCFIVYEHEDAVVTAREIFKDIKLCERPLKMIDHNDIKMIHQIQSTRPKRNRYNKMNENDRSIPQAKRSRYEPDLRFNQNNMHYVPPWLSDSRTNKR